VNVYFARVKDPYSPLGFAAQLRAAILAALLFDLLAPAEEAIDVQTRQLRFDIGLLAERLVGATD
jgi:hypothetical protein